MNEMFWDPMIYQKFGVEITQKHFYNCHSKSINSVQTKPDRPKDIDEKILRFD